MNLYLVTITITIFAFLTIDYVYGVNFNNNTFLNSTITNKILNYRFEPFLLVNGTDYKDVSHKDSLSFDNFTIVAWINTNQSNLVDPAHIVNKGGFNNEDKGKNMNYGIWLSKNGNIQGGFENEDGQVFEVTSNLRYNDGKWHYVLLSYNGSLLRLDIDGKQVSSKYTNRAIPDTKGDQPLRIGANSLDEDKFYIGKVDEVRVWNRGLTNSEIAEIYSNGTFNTIGQVIYQDFKNIFNIAVAADWGCDENATKTAENIQDKDPEIVIAAGDLSYKKSADCWFEIIEPFFSRIKIAMGDHEYSDTTGGAIGIINEYLEPLNMTKTYYSFDVNNIHFTIIDPHIDYSFNSTQYQFIEQDLQNASPINNSKIDWLFVVEHIPMYTSPSKHPANSTIRDIYHSLFDKYNVDLIFSGDNHNYQRTFPLKYNNSNNGNSSIPIISDRNLNSYSSSGDYSGQIYIITGTGGRSLYEIKQQAPFVAKQYDDQYGFLNLDFTTNNTLTATFYGNEKDNNNTIGSNNIKNNILDQFTISKTN
ncbi:MAG TPA: LamG-like jellyroll fold domain-containing protein [Nitrososphaeraceae archaeon]|nr:LamG-like jellyroll fold domain-containing protein [Nitrososphaeraceae archaeon]